MKANTLPQKEKPRDSEAILEYLETNPRLKAIIEVLDSKDFTLIEDNPVTGENIKYLEKMFIYEIALLTLYLKYKDCPGKEADAEIFYDLLTDNITDRFAKEISELKSKGCKILLISLHTGYHVSIKCGGNEDVSGMDKDMYNSFLTTIYS